MDSPEFAIPLRQIVNFVTLFQALIFAGLLMLRPFRGTLSNGFLIAALLILATVKADQLYQMLGGFLHFPQYGFLLAPFQALMTPVLYLFVTTKVKPGFRLNRGHLWHATPFVLMLVYLFAVYFSLTTAEKSAMIASGGFSTLLHRFAVPLTGDIVQLGYVVAALRRLDHYGVTLKTWFSRVETRDLRWLKRLMVLWGAIFAFHAVWTISGGLFGALPFARVVLDVLNFLHLAIVNGLMLMGVTASAQLSTAPVEAAQALPKYQASNVSPDDRQTLFGKTASAIQTSKPFLAPDLTLRDLADLMGATTREMSEAINGVGNQSFFEYINSARVKHAQLLLIEQPATRILDIAYQSGFNSKTAFNQAFRKITGQTPSAFRRLHNLPVKSARPAEKPA